MSVGMEIVFYRDVALWKDEINNEKHEKIPRSSDSLSENNPKIFVLSLFYSNSLEGKDRILKVQQELWAYIHLCITS